MLIIIGYISRRHRKEATKLQSQTTPFIRAVSSRSSIFRLLFRYPPDCDTKACELLLVHVITYTSIQYKNCLVHQVWICSIDSLHNMDTQYLPQLFTCLQRNCSCFQTVFCRLKALTLSHCCELLTRMMLLVAGKSPLKSPQTCL